MAELDTINIKNNYISDLISSHAKNDQLEHLFFTLFKFSYSAFQVPFVSASAFISTFFSQNETKIDYLMDIFQSFALSIHTLQGNFAVPPIFSQL